MAVSAQRRRRILVAGVAALIAVGAFVLALTYSSKPAQSTTPPNATGTPVPTVTVVEPSSAISQGNEITAADLKLVAVPTTLVSSLTATGGSDYTSIAELTQTNHYALTDIPAHLPVLSSEVTASEAAAAPPVQGLPSVLPAGYVAISLPYEPGNTTGSGEGTGGYIQAGDRIDILVYLSGNEDWGYQDVLVLEVGESAGAPAATPSASSSASASSSTSSSGSSGLVMVELPSQDAAALYDAENATPPAVIQYAIVSSQDYPSAGASPVPAPAAAPTQVTDPTPFFGG